jgi:hypothetical protein
LESGDVLISFGSGINGQKDHWIIKCDAEGNFLDSYTWGSDLEETYPLMKPLPDGKYAVFYEITTWQSSPDPYAKDIDWYFMKFDPTTMLPVPGSEHILETFFHLGCCRIINQLIWNPHQMADLYVY